MIQLFVKKISRSLIYITGMVCFFIIPFSFGATLTTFDDGGGESFDVQKMIDASPQIFVQFMTDFLKKGNIDAIGGLSSQLIQRQNDDDTILALHSIYLASKGQAKAVKRLLSKIKNPDRIAYALYAKAMVQRLEKQFKDAINTCDKAISMDDTHPYPLNIKGRIYFDMGDYKNAIPNFKTALKLEPQFLPAHTNLGAAFFTTGNYQSAAQHFNSALRIHPNSFRARYGLGLTYVKLGQKTAAIEIFVKALLLNPENTNILQELGPLYLENKQFKKAIETGKLMQKAKLAGANKILASAYLHQGNLKQAKVYLDNAPEKTSDIYYLTGFYYMLQGQHDQALTNMEAVLKKQSDHFGAFIAKAALKFYLNQPISIDQDLKTGWGDQLDKAIYFSRGCVQVYRGKMTKAMSSFQASNGMVQGFSIDGIDLKALKNGLNKKEMPHLNIGVIYYLKSHTDLALSEFKKGVKLNKTSVFSNYWAAQTLLKNKERKKALSYFKTAVKTSPNFFPALYAIAELSIMSGDTKNALKYYEKAGQIKKDPGVLVKLGILNERSNKFDKASIYYDELIKFHPNLFIGYNQQAWLYARQGKNLDKAIELAKKADQLQPGNASILDTLGWLLYRTKDYKAALETLNKANKISPQGPSILYHLGAVYHAMNKNDSAKTYLKRALDTSKYFEEIEEAKELFKKIN